MDNPLEKPIQLLTQKLNEWIAAAIKMLPNFFIALLVLVLFVYVSKLAKRVVDQLLKKFSQNEAANSFISGAVKFLVIVIGLFFSLGILQLDKTVTSLLAGAGVLGLALGFAFQEIATNFVAGILIAFRQPFQTGDIVEVGQFRGRIKSINLRTTVITSFDGLEVMVPNKEMFTSPLTNYTSTPHRRVELSVGVSYGDDLNLVKKTIIEALKEVSAREKSKEVEVYYSDFGSSSIDLKVFVWLSRSDQPTYLQSKSEMIEKVKAAFDTQGITIPFPIRTLDFGIKGGRTLSEAWPS